MPYRSDPNENFGDASRALAEELNPPAFRRPAEATAAGRCTGTPADARDDGRS